MSEELYVMPYQTAYTENISAALTGSVINLPVLWVFVCLIVFSTAPEVILCFRFQLKPVLGSEVGKGGMLVSPGMFLVLPALGVTCSLAEFRQGALETFGFAVRNSAVAPRGKALVGKAGSVN